MDQGRGVNDGCWPDAGVRGQLSANSYLSEPVEIVPLLPSTDSLFTTSDYNDWHDFSGSWVCSVDQHYSNRYYPVIHLTSASS